MKALLVAASLTIAAAAFPASYAKEAKPAKASAGQTSREYCCHQMHGVWRTNSHGEMLCYGIGAGNAEFYKCVAARGG